jgi:hypothetical protein
MANTFKNKTVTGIGTSANSVYTAGSGVTATIVGLTCANITTSDCKVSVQVTDTSASVTSHVVKNAPVPTEGSLIVAGGNQKIVLETGDILKVTASAASSIDVMLSILEQT